MIDTTEETLIEQVTDRLTRTYPTVPPEIVIALMNDIHTEFDGRPVCDFVPLFVERRAGGELAKLAV